MKCDGIDANAACCPLRTVSARQECGGAVAAEIGHQHAVTLCQLAWEDIGIAVDVVGPSVQQHDGRAVGRAVFGVSDIEHPGVDLLERRERCVRRRRCGAGPRRHRGGNRCRGGGKSDRSGEIASSYLIHLQDSIDAQLSASQSRWVCGPTPRPWVCWKLRPPRPNVATTAAGTSGSTSGRGSHRHGRT